MSAPSHTHEAHPITDTAAHVRTLGAAARASARHMARASAAQKSQALQHLAQLLRQHRAELIAANAIDVQRARSAGVNAAFLDRLCLSDAAIETCATGCEQLAQMPDVIGEIIGLRQRPSGIRVGQMRVPIGVFGMIFESRPNVTIEAASLAIKSGNACILRSGSEATHSCQALVTLVARALEAANLPATAVQLVQTTDRAAIDTLVSLPEYVDVIIPRGGRGLIERISEKSRVPVIKHLDGICHTYVDEDCDVDMAVRVVDNAKTQKYSPCNATETLLVAEKIAPVFLPKIAHIFAQKNVQMRGCEKTLPILKSANLENADIIAATQQDWTTEYLAPIISIKIVENIDAAITHIAQYSSAHTESILTNNHQNAQKFLREVDSASVMVNASTRFADGFEYGLGAEIGISTDKFHARGPVGIEGLTSLKFIVLGQGEIRQ